MDCHHVALPLTNSVLTYGQLEPWEKKFSEILIKIQVFMQENEFEKCCLLMRMAAILFSGFILSNTYLSLQPAGSPTPVSSQVSPPPEGTLVSQKERDLREKIAKYEAGERGHLQDVYQNVLQDWFVFGEALSKGLFLKWFYTL